MKLLGTSLGGSGLLLALMAPWSLAAVLVLHDRPLGLEHYLAFGLPLVIAVGFIECRLRHGHRSKHDDAA